MGKYILAKISEGDDSGKLYISKISASLTVVRARREEIVKAREHGPFGNIPREETEKLFRILKVVE
jgi:hypothetical protein